MIKTFWRLKKMHPYSAAVKMKSIFPELKHKYDEAIEDRLRDAEIDFYHREKVVTPVLVRLTLPIALLAMMALIIYMPVNYIITGYWGYKWRPLINWLSALGF